MSANQENQAVLDELSFKAYYESKKKEYLKIRDEICELLAISQESFYLKLRTGSWTESEKIVISHHLEMNIFQLFPTKTV